MSVQSEIDRIITAVGNAYSKVSEKGGTVPASQTVSNLATAIDSIPAGGGGAPSLQSKSVTYTANGTATITPDAGYDGLSSVDVTVNVASGGGVENEGCNITLQGYFPAGSFAAYTMFDRRHSGDVHIIPALDTFQEDYEFEFPVTNTVLKNSSFFIGGITRACVATGNIVAVDTPQDGYYSFFVTGDCQITF